MVILETKRLLLRELEPEDRKDLAEILQDPQVMYAYEHEFTDDDVQAWLDRQLERYRRDGFGLWAVVHPDTGEMVGQAGLTLQPYRDSQVLEVGYLLKRRHWHQGYAAEAAEGCKRYAFEKLGQRAVYSVIKADNAASIRVAERIGMEKADEFITQYFNGDMLHFLYRVERAEEGGGHCQRRNT